MRKCVPQYLHADVLDINIVTYLYHASRAPHARARSYYNFISPSRDVIVTFCISRCTPH